MTNQLMRFLVLTLLLTVTGLANAAVVGSVANSRFDDSWTLDGPEQVNTRAKLLNTANFGPGGISGEAITIVDTAATITTGLLSGFDTFYIGYLDDANVNAFTGAELTAMSDYVAGGGVMIVTCDDANYDAVCAHFGFPSTTSATSPVVPTAAGSVHPLFSGPFGDVTSINMSGTQGLFTTAAGATILGEDTAGSPNPTILEYTLGSGIVLLLSDVDMIANAASVGGDITSANDQFLGNLFSYAIGGSGSAPTPTSIPTMSTYGLILTALGLLLLASFRLRRSARQD